MVNKRYVKSGGGIFRVENLAIVIFIGLLLLFIYFFSSFALEETLDVTEAVKESRLRFEEGVDVVQYSAVVAEPVKWKKEFSVYSSVGFNVRLPKDSKDIVLKRVDTGEDVTELVKIGEEFFGEEIRVRLKRGTFVGNVIGSGNYGNENYELTYETPAPEIEVVQEGIKTRLKVTGPEDVHYEDVLSFAEIPEILKVGEEGRLRLYQTKHDGEIDLREIRLDAYDGDGDGFLDRVEWVTPELSEWEGYIIIEISKAERLSADRVTSLGSIYDSVKALDGVWSGAIGDGGYVRVTFEEVLDDRRDITVYPRVVTGDPRIEVYEKDSSVKLAEFVDLHEGKNTIYLTELIGRQDVFDLRVVEGVVEFDYIVDPILSVFSDTFPTDSNWDNWDGQGTPTGWIYVSGASDYHSASYGIKCETTSGTGLNCDIYSDDIDLSDADSFEVSFWYKDDDADPRDDDAVLYFYNGNDYIEITYIEAGDLGTSDDVWNFYSINVTDSQYLVSDFRIYFRTWLEKNENYWIDDVNIDVAIANLISVGIPETYDNDTLTEKTIFRRDEEIFINVSVTHAFGADNISTTLITILNPSDGVEVDNVTMNKGDAITDGYVYNYSFGIPNDAEFGTWTIEIYANDSFGNWNYNTTNFEVDDTAIPAVWFENSTSNGTITVDEIFVNVTATDVGLGDGNVSVFIDFDNSLMNWWRMDEVSGSTVIDYMGRNNGTAVADATQVDEGAFGKAFTFDGTDDEIDLTSYQRLSNIQEFTVSAWFYGNTDTAGRIIGFGASGTRIAWITMNLGELIIRSRDETEVTCGADTTTANIQPDVWNNVVLTWNATTCVSYVNGILQTVSGGGITETYSGGGYIGSRQGETVRFNGKIDDVMIFNRSLSAEEVRGLYANTTSKYLQVNYTGLEGRDYTFKAYAQDTAGNVNMTEERVVEREGVIQISTCEELQGMNESLDANYILTQNINCSNTSISGNSIWGAEGFNPIGCGSSNCGSRAPNEHFLGNFDGAGFNITGLYINRTVEYYVGLFGYIGSVGSGREIKNVSLVGVNILGNQNVGGLVGRNNGTISNSYSMGNVSGGFYVGGLVGYNLLGGINDSSSAGNISGEFSYVGGLIGINYGTIFNSYSTGNVLGLENEIGGLVGRNNGVIISNSYSMGNVLGNNNVGGLVGYQFVGTISNSYSIGSVSGEGSGIGGFVGSSSGTCIDSFWDNETSNQANSACEGAGQAEGKTTAEMVLEATYQPEWDFVGDGLEDIWKINEGVSYPCFSWQDECEVSGGEETGPSVTVCRDLNVADRVYTLQNDITEITGNCFNITANNVTLDMNGFNITGDGTGQGIYLNGYDNVSIANGSIYLFDFGVLFSGSLNGSIINIVTRNNTGSGIYLNGSNYTTVRNVISNNNSYVGVYVINSSYNYLENIITNNNTFPGVYMEWSDYNTLENITSNFNAVDGFQTEFSTGNNLTNIVVESNFIMGVRVANASSNIFTNVTSNFNGKPGSNGVGVYLVGDSSNNTFTNVNLTDNYYGYYTQDFLGSNNTLENFIMEGTDSYSIYSVNAGSSYFKDGIIVNSDDIWDVVFMANTSNNIFLNVTYDLAKEYVGVDSNAELIRKWYYQANVTFSGSPVDLANVSVYNSSLDWMFNSTTNSTGFTDMTPIIEYVNVGTRSYYSNYTINTTRSGYDNESHELNVSWEAEQGGFSGLIFDDIELGLEELDCDLTIIEDTTLEANMTCSGSAITFGIDNITLDCAGYTINYSISGGDSERGVFSNGHNNITIKDCNIVDGNLSAANSPNRYRTGIYLYSTNDSIIINNTVDVYGNNSRGISLMSSLNNTLISNTVTSNASYGIFIQESSNNTLISNNGTSAKYAAIMFYLSSNNTITSNIGISNPQPGIWVYLSSNNTLTSNTGISNLSRGYLVRGGSNNILTDSVGISQIHRGFELGNSDNNTITRLNASSGNNHSLFITNSTGNNFTDCIYINGSTDVYSDDVGSRTTSNIFLNCSYDTENVTDNTDTLIRKWYYQANVTSGGSSVDLANLSAYNVTDAWMFNLTSNSSGFTNVTEIIEYVSVGSGGGGTKTYYSNYTINTTNVTFSDSHELNVSWEAEQGGFGGLILDDIELGGAAATIGAINITYPQNTTYNNYVTAINYTHVNGAFCWYSNDSGVTNSSAVSAGTNWTGLSLSTSGSNTWTVYCNDSSGNENSSNVTFFVDNNISSCGVGGLISTPGYYVMNQSLTGMDCLRITSSDVELDCNGFSIDGSDFVGSSGIWVYSQILFTPLSNIIIRNCNISDYSYGIRFVLINSSYIYNTSFYSNSFGISFGGSVDNGIYNTNYINGESIAIYLQETSSRNEFINFSIDSTSTIGIHLREGSSYNNFSNGILLNNGRGIYFSGLIGANEVKYNRFFNLTIQASTNEGIEFMNNEYNQDNYFYNNLFNNTNNVVNPAGAENYWNTTLQNGARHYSDGIQFGGNYWTNSSGTGYSDTCPDTNTDGFCDDVFNVSTGTSCTVGVDCGFNVDYLVYSDEYGITPTIGAINITYPQNTTYNNYVTAINYTHVNGAFCWYSNDSGVTNSSVVSAGTNWTGLSLSTLGSNTWTVYCNDSSGNENSSSVSFFVETGPLVTMCRDLGQPNTVYTQTVDILNPDLSGRASCINVTAENVTLDCDGKYINIDEDFAGIYSNQFNTTIKNCNISMGTGIGGLGIRLDNSNNSVIKDNILNNQYQGLYFNAVNNSQIINNTINSNANHGINIYGSKNNNIINNNFWNCSTVGSLACIFVINSDYNVFDDNKINLSAAYGVWVRSSGLPTTYTSHNIFKNTNMANIAGTSVFLDIGLGSATIINNTFLNFSYNNESVEDGAELIRKWYYQANVTSSGSAVDGANLSAYNVSSDWMFNLTSNSSGLTNITEIIEYVNLGGVVSSYSNYTINTTYESSNESHELNVSWEAEQGGFGGLILDDIEIVETGPNVTICRDLDQPNTVYTLQNDLPEITGSCFIIGANNITLDMNGHSIIGDLAGWGFSSAVYNNVIIMNGTISNFSSGVVFFGGSENKIINLNVNLSNNIGIYLEGVLDFNLTNALVELNNWHGISLNLGVNGAVLTNITSISNGKSADQMGIFIAGSSNNKIIKANVTDNYIGVYITNSSNNSLEDFILNNNDVASLMVDGYVNDTVFRDGIVISTDGSYDAYSGNNSLNITFLNVTYNLSKEFVIVNSELIKKWYYQANVSYGGQAVDLANLSAYNVTGDWMFNLTSNSSGLTNVTEIIEYVNNGTRSYYSNYTINTTNVAFSDSHELNVSWEAEQGGFGGLILDDIELGGVPAAFSIAFSSELANMVNWTFDLLPAINQSAEKNNGAGATDFWINVSTEGGLIDLYVRGTDLMTDGLDVLAIGNETISFNKTDSTVPSGVKYSLTTNYVDTQIGSDLGDGDAVFLKFFLSAQAGQAPGVYNNTLEFKAVPAGQAP